MANLKYNLYLKVGAIVLIGLLLLIPAMMIKGLVYDREGLQNKAISEVSSKWSTEQRIGGPMLSIPIERRVSEIDEKSKAQRIVTIKEFLHVLPSSLSIKGDIKPEKRSRGIYDVVVYDSDLSFKGEFDMNVLKDLDLGNATVNFSQARLTLGIDDLRGLEDQIKVKWNDSENFFNSGLPSMEAIPSGLNTLVPISNESPNYSFNFDVKLKGSQLLYFTPVGKVTNIELNSKWSNPGFNGSFLPDERTVTPNGFNAKWNVLNLNRNFPQAWIGTSHQIRDASFGVDLLLPVDNYQKTHRAVNYAILFIGFTFMVFFFIEIMNKVFIHPVQYILVGVGLVVFFTLLLSISEYLNFNLSYIISALATLTLIGLYIKSILKNNTLVFLIVGILLLLYVFIFIIIQLQDYALLVGSIGIFIILAIVMYYSRKIDWYNLDLKE